MKTTTHIKNRNRLFTNLRKICSLRNWLLISAEVENKWLIYEKGELILKVSAEITEDTVILTLFTLLLQDMSKSDEVFLRGMLSEKDIRDQVKSCTIKLFTESVWLSKHLRLNVNKKDTSIMLLNAVDELLMTRNNACIYIQNKMDYLLFVKLN
jgi:hypothetical protein